MRNMPISLHSRSRSHKAHSSNTHHNLFNHHIPSMLRFLLIRTFRVNNSLQPELQVHLMLQPYILDVLLHLTPEVDPAPLLRRPHPTSRLRHLIRYQRLHRFHKVQPLMAYNWFQYRSRHNPPQPPIDRHQAMCNQLHLTMLLIKVS
jgi:hypothetical protein